MYEVKFNVLINVVETTFNTVVNVNLQLLRTFDCNIVEKGFHFYIERHKSKTSRQNANELKYVKIFKTVELLWNIANKTYFNY